MLDYRINTFLTLCDTMNYRKTAEILHITQPAVTGHIHWLEEQLGCKLFSYDGRDLIKTRQAQLLERTSHAMRYQESQLMLSLEKAEGYQISMGATKTIGEFVLGDHVCNYLKDAGNRIHVEVENTKVILEKLDKGELDFALIEGYFNREQYESRLYRREDFLGICSVNNPLANQQVKFSELLSQHLLVREEGSGTRNILELMVESMNYSLESFQNLSCISSFGLMNELLAGNCGITFAYASVKKNNPKLASFSVKDWNLSREFNYVYLPDTEAEKKVDFFETYRIHKENES